MLLFLALPYGLLALLYALMQERLIFFPSRLTESETLARAAAEGWRPWRDADGHLVGWRKGHPEARNRLLVFHGNAGSAQDRRDLARAFTFQEKGAQWEVVLMEYPGYGSRPGRPGQSSMVAAGLGALQSLREEDLRPVYLLGESIGSGVACGVAGLAPDEVAGLLLITPFRSLQEVAQQVVPWMPVGWFLRHPFDNAAALARYRGPVAVVLAGQDEVVGPATGRALFDGYTTGPKWLDVQEQAGHNDIGWLPALPWLREAGAFLEAK